MAFASVLQIVVASPASAAAPMANTRQGLVRGVDDGRVSRFLGVPFAAPPLGDLRFRPPAPAPVHGATLTATSYGPACPQLGAPRALPMSEDCLTLNVFRPDGGDTAKPIMVFLYGGSFKYGTAAPEHSPGGPDYDGGAIAARTGAIVVTVNYRIGALGFLAAKALDAGDGRGVSGNYGLLDQTAALRWVTDNARAFGSDPSRVLLFGQSAGAVSVIDQMISPAAQGLFGSVEIESAGALPSATLAELEKLDAPVLADTGCEDAVDQAACLRGAPLSKLLAADIPIGPNVDGRVIPLAPMQALASGAFARVPAIVLTNRDEGTFFIAAGVQHLGHAATASDFAQTLTTDFMATGAAQIRGVYPLSAGTVPGQVLSSVLTDEFYACPALGLRQVMARYVPVLQTEFAQPNPVRDYPVPTVPSIVPGDAHTSELAYVFGHDGSGAPLSRSADRRLSDAIIDGLGSLARSGGLPVAQANPMVNASGVLTLSQPPMWPDDFSEAHHCAFWAASGIKPKLIERIE